jgi:rare lipoprotein A
LRRLGSLLAACSWLLLSACRDAEPPKQPIVPLQARSARAAEVVLSQPDVSVEPAPTSLARASAKSQPYHAQSGELAQRFAAARPLSTLHGSASYYADSLSGRKTASGEPYRPERFTAAHRSLPFGSVLRVTRVQGGQVVYVKVTDRGPYGPRGRILDLSRAAADELGMLRAGVVKVRVDVVEYGPPRKKRRRR